MSISELDPRKIITGKDSRIFVGIGDDLPTFLAEAASWTASLNFTNAEVQPLMSMVSVAVPASVSISITLEEIVVRDDVMLEPLITALRRGIVPWFTINSQLNRPLDDQEEFITFSQCVPDGSVDLLNLQPGEIVRRAWNLRGNMLPQYQKLFAYDGQINSEYTHYQG